jgi:hypothetical protein
VSCSYVHAASICRLFFKVGNILYKDGQSWLRRTCYTPGTRRPTQAFACRLKPLHANRLPGPMVRSWGVCGEFGVETLARIVLPYLCPLEVGNTVECGRSSANFRAVHEAEAC